MSDRNRCQCIAAAVAVAVSGILAGAAPAAAQDGWAFAGQLMQETLAGGQSFEGGPFWLPDTADPGTSSHAIGVGYLHIPGSAGSVSMAAGVFGKRGAGWTHLVPVTGLFGFDPRDTVWHGGPSPTRVELTTTTLKDGEPRCCPSGATRWSIDLASGIATRR